LVALVVGIRVLGSRRSELSGTATALGHLHPQWLAVAIVLEGASLGAYAALQRRLLKAAGVDVGAGPLVAITLAGYSIQNSLPGGPAWSAVFAYRQFRRRGADAVQAGWTMAVASILSGVGLAVLGVAGVVLAGGQAPTADVVKAIVAAAVIVAAIVWSLRRGLTTERGIAVAAWAVRVWQRVTRRPVDDPRETVRRTAQRLFSVRPSRTDWAVASALAVANWLLDCACLALAFSAVGAGVPWRALLLAYGTGQLAANLPVTPGGLGVVEGSLSIALVLYGGAQDATVAAVLLYRIISFWSVLPLGWGSWAALRWAGRRQGHVALEPVS